MNEQPLPVELASVTKIASDRDLVGIDDEDTGQLRAMHAAAMDYIQSFKWKKGVTESYFGLGLDDAKTPESAARVYFGLMDDWANAVLEGSALNDVFPVAAKPTVENALDLKSRIQDLREMFT